MDEINRISTEVLPLVYVENWFRCSILGIFGPIFFKFCMRVDIRKQCYGIAYRLIL